MPRPAPRVAPATTAILPSNGCMRALRRSFVSKSLTALHDVRCRICSARPRSTWTADAAAHVGCPAATCCAESTQAPRGLSVVWLRPAVRMTTSTTGGTTMASQTAAASSLALERNATEVATRSSFFFWISALLLSFVLIGFAPTLYLRAFFPVAPMPGYLYAHGAILTAWFAWLLLQTSLVRGGNTATHRRMGVIGACIAAAAVVAGPLATVGVVDTIRAAGLDWDTDMSALPFL